MALVASRATNARAPAQVTCARSSARVGRGRGAARLRSPSWAGSVRGPQGRRLPALLNDGDGVVVLPNVELSTQPNGKYAVKGSIELPVSPAAVYEVLVDFAGAPDIFSNIMATEVLPKQDGKLNLLQRCRWKFLLFSGTFDAILSVREETDQRVLLFELVKSSFMKEFEGRWKVTAAPSGGAVVEHTLAVKPSLSLPGGMMGGYTSKIFVEQEMQVLEDLKAELDRRGGQIVPRDEA